MILALPISLNNAKQNYFIMVCIASTEKLTKLLYQCIVWEFIFLKLHLGYINNPEEFIEAGVMPF